MLSRFYADVLNKHHWVESFGSNYTTFPNNGLYFIAATAPTENSAQLVDEIMNQLKRLKDGKFHKDELQRAKNQLKQFFASALESRSVRLHEIAQTLMNYNRVIDPKETFDLVDQTTEEDLKKVAQALFKGPITFAAVGDISRLPSSKDVEAKYESIRK